MSRALVFSIFNIYLHQLATIYDTIIQTIIITSLHLFSTDHTPYDVGRSAHGIHFSDRDRYIKYRQRCLELFGQDYYKLPNRIYEHWHPFRIS